MRTCCGGSNPPTNHRQNHLDENSQTADAAPSCPDLGTETRALWSHHDRSLSEAARQKNLHEVEMVEPGRFGSSREKEAAARRFGVPPLWVFERCPASGELDCLG
jgi:hypothetical protein